MTANSSPNHIMQTMPPVIVIPAYQPGPALPGMVHTLLQARPDLRVLVMDDGSSAEHMPVFSALQAMDRVTLLRHKVNLGKGQALKTAFNHFLTSGAEDSVGVVTADADGQHRPEDILAVAEDLAAKPETLVLGVRQFQADVPLRSRLGNIITRNVFRLLFGKRISDTQTGLRGIPRSFLPDCLDIPLSGYDYELEMLGRAARSGMEIAELSIATVYEDGNTSSHFNPIRDSFKVYFVFLRFSALALATAGLDYLVFTAAYGLIGSIFLGTALARVAAGVFNFSFGKRLVFRSRDKVLPEAIKYVLLVSFMMVLSYGLIRTLAGLGLNVYLSKVLAEGSLFLLSFAALNTFVFQRRDPVKRKEIRATDWNRYYSTPVHPVTRWCRARTAANLNALLKKHAPEEVRSILEAGGANSCVFSSVRLAFPRARYIIVDTNALGLSAFQAAHPDAENVELLQQNMLDPTQDDQDADIVFSLGLIEHFTLEDTARMVRAHFRHARPGGLVVLFFPTPTLQYRLTRGLLRLLGMWRFHDERPLRPEEVLATAMNHGETLHRSINRLNPLTQACLVLRKQGETKGTKP